MLYRVIEASELPALVEAFMQTHEVVAPVKKGNVHTFDVISSPDEIELDYAQTIASPKKYFLPPVETLMTFDAQGNQVTDYTAEITPRVIFGAHACDINALNRLDVVYKDGRYKDPYYIARRAATLIVGISCMPTDKCFCHLWSSDEARFGYDLFLQDIGGKYLVSIASNDAANILESACNPREATDAERIEFRHATRARQAAFNPDIPEIQDVAMLMDAFHKDAFWEELGGRCLACGACASVCPTGAAHMGSDGIVEVDHGRCIGCLYCMAACPYNARTFNWNDPVRATGASYGDARVPERARGVMEKCTLCKERTDEGDEPMCVRCCPADARIFGDLDDPDSAVSRLRRDQGAEVLLEDKGTRPQVFYVR